MQPTILVILPTWAVVSLSLFLPPQILPKSTLSQRTVMNGKQDVLKQPEANTDLLYFSALTEVVIKALLKQISLYYYRIFARPDNKTARNHQQKSCVLKNHTKITMMRGQYYFN